MLAVLLEACGNDNADAPTVLEPGSEQVLSGLLSPERSHYCQLDSSNTIICNGHNSHGQTDQPEGSFSAITNGWNHTCALKTDGTTTCWGSNEYGQSTPPQQTFQTITAGAYHTCALKTDGTTTCWGYTGLADQTIDITVGSWHYCILRGDQKITCEGDNAHNQIDPLPDQLFIDVSANALNTCAIDINNSVHCWGYADLKVPAENNGNPTKGEPGSFFTVATGRDHACGLITGNPDSTYGTISCWGSNNNGQASPVPTGNYTEISSGWGHSCGLRTSGTVTCWGGVENLWNNTPSQIFTTIASGGLHACGLQSDGAI
ncbi:MAG: RCC1 domain-containing protein, partial [Acidimicrobiaceae bacterium]|nr:RCC1 domain-containing protein [Acidimicrobiaceae bacterium]